MLTGADLHFEDDAPVSPDEGEMTGPLRRCIVTGEVLPKERLLRFAVAPDGALAPDISGKLPGRGMWIKADRATLETALAKNPFSRVARRQVKIPANCADQITGLLRQRLIDGIGLARRAGCAVTGFEKTESWVRSGKAAALVIAADAGKGGRAKLVSPRRDLPVIDMLDSAALGGIFATTGAAVYAAIGDRTHAARLILLADRVKTLSPVYEDGK